MISSLRHEPFFGVPSQLQLKDTEKIIAIKAPQLFQGDVYLEDGRLVSEDSSPLSRDFLTNKLVADSLMWQETHQCGVDQPSPQEEDGGGVSVHHLAPPQRGDVAVRRQETKPVNVVRDFQILKTYL